MEKKFEFIQRNKSLRASIRDATYFSAMVGLAEAYFGAFAISLGAAAGVMGLLGSIPQLFASVWQLFAIRLLRGGRRSRRTLAVLFASLQGAVLLPIAGLALAQLEQAWAPWLLLGMVIVYFVFGGLTAPPWNSLIGDLVDADKKGAFFGYRNARTGLVTFLSLLSGGAILAATQRFDLAWLGFFALFLTGAACRLLSAWYLSLHDDPPSRERQEHFFTFWQFLKRLPSSNFAKFVLFYSLMNASIAVGGPFVSLYLLRDLGLSYGEFTAFAAITLLTQYFTFFHWGKLCDRFGAKGMLQISGFGIVFFPLALCISSSYFWLLATHALHGLFWSGFLVSAQVFLFDAVTPEKRARCVTYQNVLNGVFGYLGALLGVWSTQWGFVDRGLFTIESNLILPFLLSGLLRLACMLFLERIFKEVREVPKLTRQDVVFRIANVRAIAGARFGVVWATVRSRQRNEAQRDDGET